VFVALLLKAKEKKWGRKRRTLYEREKKRDKGGWVGWSPLVGTGKRDGGGYV
jgi:hypothetical protein